MSQTINVSDQQVAIYNALVPPEGPRSVTVPLDFALSPRFTVDFTLAYMRKVISMVQSVWVDNSLNTAQLVFTVEGTGEVLKVPPGSQGSFPIISAIRGKITVATTTAIATKAIFLNVPLPQSVWATAGENFLYRDGALEVIGPVSTPVAGNTEIVNGGTVVTVFPANSIEQVGLITNPAGASESLFVDVVNNADTLSPGAFGTTFEVPAGRTFRAPPSTIAVTANAITSGHTFVAVSV